MKFVLGRDVRDRGLRGWVIGPVGDKWSILVIGQLRDRTLRFGELHRAVTGISQRMLTLTLRQPERDGLVTRTVHACVPPRVDHALTERPDTHKRKIPPDH